MQVTTSPHSRFGWEGTTLEYVVKADGATELRVPEHTLKGVDARITDIRQTSEGVEARVKVDVAKGSFV